MSWGNFPTELLTSSEQRCLRTQTSNRSGGPGVRSSSRRSCSAFFESFRSALPALLTHEGNELLGSPRDDVPKIRQAPASSSIPFAA